MRTKLVSLCLSLSILALSVVAGLWLLRRGDPAPDAGRRPAGAGSPLDGGGSPEGGQAAGAGDAAQAEGPGSEPSDPASEPSVEAPEAAVAIEGRVTDAGGDGVAGARVAAVERRALTDALAKDAKLLEREPLEALRAFRGSFRGMAERLPSCLTAADGTYALRGLPEGEHRVVVEHPDFLTHEDGSWILVETGRKARYDVELVAGQTISGLVRDTKGLPVADARVRATPVETARLKGFGQLVQVFIDQTEGASLFEARPVETDAAGAFRLTSLEPGAYDLRLVKEGYAWGEARGVPSGTQGIVIPIEPAIRLTGRVVSPAGNPIAGAEILLREPDHDLHGPEGPMAVAFVDIDLFREKERVAATDDEGRFALEAFTAGAYELIVRAGGFPEHTRSVPIEGVATGHVPIGGVPTEGLPTERVPIEGLPTEGVPTEGVPSEGVPIGGVPKEGASTGGAGLDLGDIVLEESREIAGAVVSPEGWPVEGAEVWVPRPSARREDRDSRRHSVLTAGASSSLARARTDDRGAFRLAGLVGGSHEVAVLADGYPGDLLEAVAGSRSVMIALERGLTLRGRVVDAESGDPVPGARVSLEGRSARERAADADGRFELRGVRLQDTGSFGESIVVRASLEGYREARETVAFPDPASSPEAETTIELRRLGSDGSEPGISGVVRRAGGQPAGGEPIADARVWIEVPGWPQAFLRMGVFSDAKEVRTDADGTFLLPAPRVGRMRFEVVASHPGLATSRAGPFAPDDGDSGWPLVEIELGEGACVEGRVTSLDGAPVSGASVRIWRDAQVPAEATIFTRLLPQAVGQVGYSGEDGTYRIRMVEPGSYRLEARAQGYAAKAVGPLEIPTALTPMRVDIALDAGGSIAGRVIDPEGNPLAGVEVVAFPIVEISGAARHVAASGASGARGGPGASGGPGARGASGDPEDPENEDELVQTGALGVAAAVTGADGAYEIDHLPDGEFRVLARARGYEPAWILSAAPGRPLADLVLTPCARIVGRVRDATTGAPIGSFEVRLERRDAEGTFQEDRRKGRDVDDAEGRFACEGLRSGEWRVRVASSGYAPWERTVDLAPGGSLELEPVLSPGRRIEGVVVRPDGAPIPGATVTARREGQWRGVGDALSGGDGGFVIGGLDAGSYKVRAVHPEYYAEGAEGEAGAEISEAEDGRVRLVLRPAGKIFGRIRGVAFKRPGVDVWIVVATPIAAPPDRSSPMAADPADAGVPGRRGGEGAETSPPPGPAPPFQVWTDESGAFHRESVRPGKYRLDLVHRRSGPDTGNEWIDVLSDGRSLGDVEIRSGEMAIVQDEAAPR